ncbi:hypothetical protein HMPREF1991_02923 [Hoylesella loescheii DSM 19665 = JCM 12249 = ATCC 15930]|uniref:Uncharacterized protein n=1 Tax=Hoylesella loescheii DSM 19665 = JCM 12249 = ATCC 15930 TaxID=1122985 RepID=A0A069QDP4_HOYLO|nr:hypothetical protein HMPREF1991_02923 [Hoylesella loescheii DSM 19665 = JCM 12249 = ATCC 15930]
MLVIIKNANFAASISTQRNIGNFFDKSHAHRQACLNVVVAGKVR